MRRFAFAAAEILQLRFGKAQTVHLRAHRADIDGLGRLHLEQHAAGEIDAIIEPVDSASQMSEISTSKPSIAKA